MQASELRIGNVITNTIDKEVFNCKLSDINNIDNGWKSYKPIKLTEEWLLKFGFNVITRKGRYGIIYAISINDYMYCIEVDFNKQPSYFVGIEYTDSHGDMDKTFNFSFNLKYVHQLQNLYYALTQKELTVK